MSSGQRKKVSIAKALVKKTKIILADEPTYSLDFASCREVLSLIEKFVEEGITTVVVTTRSEEVARMADRVIRIKDGKMAATCLDYCEEECKMAVEEMVSILEGNEPKGKILVDYELIDSGEAADRFIDLRS